MRFDIDDLAKIYVIGPPAVCDQDPNVQLDKVKAPFIFDFKEKKFNLIENNYDLDVGRQVFKFKFQKYFNDNSNVYYFILNVKKFS